MTPFKIHSSKFPWPSDEAKQRSLKGIENVIITILNHHDGFISHCEINVPESHQHLFGNCSKAHFGVIISKNDFIKMTESCWIVNTKGTFNERSFEISVVRKNNTHGQRSYGWFDENKLLISHNGGPCHDPVTEKVWNKLILLAHEVADEMNNEEAIIHH